MSTTIVAHNGRNTKEESYRCNVAEIIINSFNNKILGDYRCELSYDNIKRIAIDDRDFNTRPDISSIITEQVNFFLSLEDVYFDKGNRDYFLAPYIEFVNSNYILNSTEKTKEEQEIVRMLFYNIHFEDFFDDIANSFLKSRINSLFNVY